MKTKRFLMSKLIQRGENFLKRYSNQKHTKEMKEN